MLSMSRRSGTFVYVLTPSASREEKRIGSAAFFEPLTWTVPSSRRPPLMTILSMVRLVYPPGMMGSSTGEDEMPWTRSPVGPSTRETYLAQTNGLTGKRVHES